MKRINESCQLGLMPKSGSGKTYTMWGPPNAFVEENSSSKYQKGLTPRVFEQLFARIEEVGLTLFILYNVYIYSLIEQAILHFYDLISQILFVGKS